MPCIVDGPAMSKRIRMRVEVICAAGIARKEKAMNAIARALLSTYLDHALSNIERLEMLACEQKSGWRVKE